jgi:Flp pilus assembly pilin Flp
VASYMMAFLAAHLRGLIKEERGADAIEYLLVIGVICVAVVGLVASGAWNALINAVFAAVQTAVTDAINS